ncbi:hypothetical protein Hanom_Chr00s147904g01821081 [Helianthus anomalus]
MCLFFVFISRFILVLDFLEDKERFKLGEILLVAFLGIFYHIFNTYFHCILGI